MSVPFRVFYSFDLGARAGGNCCACVECVECGVLWKYRGDFASYLPLCWSECLCVIRIFLSYLMSALAILSTLDTRQAWAKAPQQGGGAHNADHADAQGGHAGETSIGGRG